MSLVVGRTVTLTVELTAEEAAALARFAARSNREHALSVLYAHVAQPIRDEQVSSMLSAFAQIDRALVDVATFPWLETGRAE